MTGVRVLGSPSRGTMALAVGAGLAGAAFVGYCFYFDNKRRAAPDFRQKLREKRRAAREARQSAAPGRPGGGGGGGGGDGQLPDMANADPSEIQQFFLQEVQLGEELLAEGSMEQGVEHLCNAVHMCGQPQQLLGILQQTLPPDAFALLLRRLPAAEQRLRRAASAAADGPRVEELIVDAELE